jgi:type I restriction enzyme, S subunit
MSGMAILPKSWRTAPLTVVATLNPPKGSVNASPESRAHFVPMASIKEEFGGIDISATRPLKEVIKGYTAFREGDVLFAKITPCMENGKLAVVPPLEHGVGFGSTEFHVLRSSEVTLPEWIAHYLSQAALRRRAKRSMTGSAGQLRVPSLWLAEQSLPIPPLGEQHRIVAKIEELFSDLDAGVAALERAKANLKRYRAAVLKAAVEGKLTEQWRSDHPNTEPASKLLARILTERRQKWEAAQLAKFAAAGKEPPTNWRSKYVNPTPPDRIHLPELREGWAVASLEQLTSAARPICYGILMPKENVSDGVLFVKVKDMKGDRIDLSSLHRTRREIAEKFARASLKPGDLLLAIRGTYGRIAEVPPELDGGNITQDTARLAVADEMDCGFIAWMLRASICQSFFKRVARGVAVKGVNIADVRRCPILVPPFFEQVLISAEVAEKLSQIDAAAVAIDHGLLRAARLRQSILKQAFEGKLVPQDPQDEPASVLLKRICL